MPLIMALEPRWMFDGAAAVDVGDAVSADSGAAPRSVRRAGGKDDGEHQGTTAPRRAAPWVMALEPRMMFDGAAVADAVQAAAVRMRSMPPMDSRE